jgi:pimeloyl-ACP methyl ester carboxylesterase
VITHRTVTTNGISMHVAEAGQGPLVLLLHGFPELWFSFRHQLEMLADAGYRAVAPDLRGYGQTDAPAAVDQYTLLHLAGDVVGLLAALDEQECVVVGHDWGSPLATALTLFRPDLVRGMVLLSTPYFPRGEVDFLTELTAKLGEGNYQVWFQEPGAAEAALEADVAATVKASILAIAGDAEDVHSTTDLDTTAGMPTYGEDGLPGWLAQEDLDYYIQEFSRTGYRGALNWYRNHVPNWELMAAWHQAPIMAPSLFVSGDRDPVLNWPGSDELLVTMARLIPNLTKSVILPGCGHWTQQERPAEVNQLLLEFLDGLGGSTPASPPS